MALKAPVYVSDVPSLDQVPEIAALSLCSTRLASSYVQDDKANKAIELQKFVVMGHRGYGMNILQSADRRMKSIKENTILSFHSAAQLPIDFIEFDVQVTKDDCPVIFHDNFILTQQQGEIIEKRVTDITLSEFLSYGPQKDGTVRKPLLRKTKDGRIFEWKVEQDDSLCTLQEAFDTVDSTIGFDIELKFDDQLVYTDEKLKHILQAILQVVYNCAKDRPVMFSSFQPDAAQLIRKLQGTYPVFFLTNGGSEIYPDTRRSSLDEAIKVCLEGGLQGIVSEVKAIFRNLGSVKRIKESKLSLISYGQLNNVPELVYMQHMMGMDGVVVDLVKEIVEGVSDFMERVKEGEEGRSFGEEWQTQVKTKPGLISTEQLSFLLKLTSA